MQLTAIPVDPQVGGANPQMPVVAPELPGAQVDGLFANSFVGADIRTYSPELPAVAGTPSSAAHNAPPGTDSARPAPARLLDARGAAAPPVPDRETPPPRPVTSKPVAPAPETSAVAPKVQRSDAVAVPVADVPAPPAPREAKLAQAPALPAPKTHASQAASLPAATAPPAGPQDRDRQIPLQVGPDAQAADITPRDRPRQPVAARPAVDPVMARYANESTQVNTPAASRSARNHALETQALAPRSVARPADVTAAPAQTDPMPAPKARQVARGGQPPPGAPAPSDTPCLPGRHETFSAQERLPLPAGHAPAPENPPPVAATPVEPNVVHSRSQVARQPAAASPATTANPEAPRPMPAVPHGPAPAADEITVRIVARRAAPTPSKPAGSPAAPVSAWVADIPRPAPAQASPQSPMLPQPNPTPHQPNVTPYTPDAPAPAAQTPPAERHRLAPEARPLPTNAAARQSGSDTAPRVLPAWAGRSTPAQPPPKDAAPASTQAAIHDSLTARSLQGAPEFLDPLPALNGSDGPASAERTPPVDAPRRADSAMGRADLARSVAAQIGDAVRTAPDGKIEVRLAPEELGRIRLSISQSELGVNVTITAERAETLDLIRRNAELFAQDLRHLGHQNIGFSFEQGAGHLPFDNRTNAPADAAQSSDPPSDTGPRQPHLNALAGDGRLDIRL